ncbi:MAG: peptidylprolyl isomerase [Bryobacteraceae bacterium]
MRPHLLAALVLCPLTIAWAQATEDTTPASELEAVVTTDLGSFRFEFADKAPKHVANFIKLAREHYYDGSGFYRVGKAYVQGGDPLFKDPKTERKDWGKGGLDMLAPELGALSHLRGVVSTYHSFRHSDGAQFFIMVADVPSFDGGFSSFGRVTEGMDVVDKINSVPHSPENGIVNDLVRIKTITIEKKKAHTEPKSAAVDKQTAQK